MSDTPGQPTTEPTTAKPRPPARKWWWLGALVLGVAAVWWWTQPDLGRVLERGRDALAAGELAKARAEAVVLREWLERPAFATHPLREDGWRFVADAHEADGDLGTAVSAWERVAAIAPEMADEARFKLGSLYLRQYRGTRRNGC